MLLAGINAKAQHHNIEKRLLWQCDAAGAVIIAGVEMQLVNAAAVIITLQHGRITTTVVISDYSVEQLKLGTFNAVQLDLQIAARATMGSIQYVCG